MGRAMSYSRPSDVGVDRVADSVAYIAGEILVAPVVQGIHGEIKCC